MRKILSVLVFILAFVTGCKRGADPVVADAFHRKLYLSKVLEKIPYASTKEDSLLFMEQYVKEWILRQTLLAHARSKLTQKEQDFSYQMEQYYETLLINSFLQKVSRDSALFIVSKTELLGFINETKTDNTPEYIDVVKLNYVKLSKNSKLYKQIKELFFDEKNRVKAIKQLELLCADTIEYYLDGEHWFYTDFIERELPFSFYKFEKDNNKDKLDILQDEYRYLIYILDRKQLLQPKNTLIDRKVAYSLLQHQKRNSYISIFQDSLVNRAVSEKKVTRYPIFTN